MIRQLGTVLRVEGDLAWVECARGGACAICPGRGSCEVAALASGRSLHRMRARTRTHRVVPGAEVVVGVPAGALLRAALLAYALPLATLLAGVGLGSIAGPLAGGAGAVLGLAAGVALASRASRAAPACCPVILDTVES